MKPLWNFTRVGLGDGMNTCSWPSGCTGQPPTLGCQARPPPSAYDSADCRTQMDATSPSPDDEGMDGLHKLIAGKSKNLVECRKFAKPYSTAMSRDASNESATTRGADAPLSEPE